MSKANDIMLSMAKGVVTPEPAPEPVPEPVVDPVVDPTPEPTPEPEPIIEPAQDDDPVVNTGGQEPVVDPEPEPEPEPVDPQGGDDDIFSSWDDDTDPAPDPLESSVNDFSEISNAIGLEESTENKDSFINSIKEKFSSYEQKVKDLSENQMPENVPDALKEAVKIASQGGDYSAYINVASVDYNAVSDVDLVANSVASHFEDSEGKVNEERLDKYLDSLSDDQLAIEASKIRQQLVNHRQSQMQYIEAQAKEKKAKMLSGVKSALANFNEMDNFKVMPHHKDIIAKSFSEDKVIQDLFYTKGQFDPNKAVRVVFQHKYGSKIINNLSNRVKNSTKKEIINQMSNVQVERPSQAPNVTPQESPKGLDLWMQSLKQ